MSTAGVRLARVIEADQIARITLDSWQATGILPEGVLAQLSLDDLELSWTQALLNPPTGDHALLIAHEGDVITGYALIGPGTDPDGIAIPGVGELFDLVIDPTVWRQGHGSRLMAAAADLTRETGWTTWVTWCPIDDEIRRAFLVSAGWGPDGAYRDLAVDGDRVLRQVRLVTDLTPGGSEDSGASVTA